MSKNTVYTDTRKSKHKDIFVEVHVNNAGEVQKIMGGESGIMGNSGYLWRKEWYKPIEPVVNEMQSEFVNQLRKAGVQV